jgi:large repetitive protein
MRGRKKIIGLVLTALTSSMAVVGIAAAPQAAALQPVPGHTALVPQTPRTDVARITNGEIWDIEVSGTRVFIAGSFTSIADAAGNTTPLAQASLAAYDINTGKIDRTFRPTFGGGGVTAVEASPDGTKLYVAGSFNTVGGVSKKKVASLNMTTGAAIAGFTASPNSAGTALAVTNTTVYLGGNFTAVTNIARLGLVALNGTTGAVITNFNFPLTGGIGVNGALTVQQLKLTHDETKLLVVHTGRQIAGQDRLGMGLISTGNLTTAPALLPWRSRLWDDNLSFVGGVTRIYAGDIAPNDQYFVVTSGSGGDRPPISDVAVAFPIAGADNVQPLWVSRHFDSVYSVAITEKAVYVGGHFQFEESPTATQPWPGLDNVGYGTGQGLAGYGLGDEVVRRDHIGALDPATGTALEWDPGSNSFEGNKAMEATSRGLFAGGDATTQGGFNVGRVAFYDFNSVPAASALDTTITTPIEGRVEAGGVPFTVTGQATTPATTGVSKVQLEVQDRDSKQYLQDDLTTWGASNTILTTLATPNTSSTSWSLPLTLTGNRRISLMAKTFAANGTSDATKASKKIESFSVDDQTPTTSISGPFTVTDLTFTATGTATDDHGVNALSYYFRMGNLYLQDDGSIAPVFNTFRGLPDVVGATHATWSYTVTLPIGGAWQMSATAIDTAGQADLRGATFNWNIVLNGIAPSVSISAPVAMTPPFAVPTVVVSPGGRMTFSGTASDDNNLRDVEIRLRNTTTRENLASDGTWGVNVLAGSYRISPIDINGPTYNWTYTTPFNLTPGTYSFSVQATDDDAITTSTTNQGRLTISAQVFGDSPPDGLLTFTAPPLGSLHLDLAGTATDDHGVASVRVAVLDNATNRYLQADGTMVATFATRNATLGTPNGTSTTWTLPIDLPTGGDYSITAWAWDTVGQQDPSTTGATARYAVFPGDLAPTIQDNLSLPVTGTAFNQGVIVVTGRANDDFGIARAEVGIVNAAGQYMSSTGTFTSTTPSWRAAFLNSPGSLGSNYSYTTPVIPAGTYSMFVRPTDDKGQIGPSLTATGLVVTLPPNNPPVAVATASCVQNVCTFDGRASTDEDTTSLTYAWNFGTGQGTATGPLPTKTFTAPGTFAVTLTVKDEWNVTGTTTLTQTIVMPAGNTAPVPTFITSCTALTCGTSSAGTVDPDLGDVISYLWVWGDGTANSTTASPSHTYALQGTYTVTLTTTDGWGNSATVSHTVTMTEPVTNVAPTVTFTTNCVGLACLNNSVGTVDPDGDVIRYSWNFGDGTAVSTAASPSHTYTVAGTYAIALTVTDGWNKATTVTQSVTVAP